MILNLILIAAAVVFVECDYESKYNTELKSLPADEVVNEQLKRLAFGSCQRIKFDPTEIFNSILKYNPNLFLFIGDNVYAELGCCNPECLAKEYEAMRNYKPYKEFVQKLERYDGIYDDHDYGINDGDATYAYKEQSRQLLLDFFDKPKDHYRRFRSGAYFSTSYINPNDPEDHVKVIVLDTRYNRDCYYQCICTWCELPTIAGRFVLLKRLFNYIFGLGCLHKGDVLGEEQWRWLEGQLHDSSAVSHVIVSSFQVFTEFPISESWGLLPQSKRRLLELLRHTKPKNTVFISGDVHYGEIYHKKGLAEITSSSLTHSIGVYNVGRIKLIRLLFSFFKRETYTFNNFGALTFNFSNKHTIPFDLQSLRSLRTIYSGIYHITMESDNHYLECYWYSFVWSVRRTIFRKGMSVTGGVYGSDGELKLSYENVENMYDYMDDRDSVFGDPDLIKCKTPLELILLISASASLCLFILATPYIVHVVLNKFLK